MNTNATLCRNGIVLTGEDLERYSKRKGLCHLCARVVTHKKGKLLKRYKWKPLTIENEETKEYLVYKGYCIQPTCYTLDQAKEILGEKQPNPRRSIRKGAKPIISVPLAARNVTKSAEVPLEEPSDKIMDDSSLLSIDPAQLENAESNRAASIGLRESILNIIQGRSSEPKPPERPSSPSSQFNSSHKWSRELPLIRLPSSADSRADDEEKSSNPASELSISVHVNSKEPTESADPLVPEKKRYYLSVATDPQKKDDKKSRKHATSQEESSQGDDPTIDSIASFSSTMSTEEDVDSHLLSTKQSEHEDHLPGSGFVSGTTEGSYRAALQSLDMAAVAAPVSQAAAFDTQDSRYLCLQSKQLDRLDIEIVAVEVDSKTQQFLIGDFLLDDDDEVSESVAGVGNVNFLVVESSGTRLVRLSHVCTEGYEELELETDLNKFSKLDLYCLEGQESFIFKSRALLEAEIDNCKAAIDTAKVSDDPSIIKSGIMSRSRLGFLLPLRKSHRSRKELEKKIKKLSKKIEALGGADLERRFQLATEKSMLVRQLEEEKLDEHQLHKSKTDDSWSKGGAQEREITEDLVAHDIIPLKTNGIDPLRSVTSSAGIMSTRSGLLNTKLERTTEQLEQSGAKGSGVKKQLASSVTEVSMTVFQSAPLAYVDRTTGTHHVCPLLDFEYEKGAILASLRDAERAGAKMAVEFDIATTDRLSAFLAKSESRVMHLSCHGHPDYLALENGFGGMQILPVRDLKRFIAAGAGNLDVVFVSACHSKAAGKAFLKAGIRHVICCRQDDKFRDEGAIEFARSFYRALGLNNTLKQAFNMAREAMRVSPMVKDSKAEYEKFILLPELPADDPYHDVHVFNQANQQRDGVRRLEEPGWKRKTRIIPRTPPFFIGREMDMYTILEALRSNDIIRVDGPTDIGKASLVAATARYIEQRHKSFLFDETFWLPVQTGPVPSNDQLYLDLSKMFDMISRASESPCQDEEEYLECWGRALHQLHDKRPLIVIHGACLASRYSLESLESFVRSLLRISNAKVITVGVPALGGVSSAVINVEALDFDATVLLFARLSRSASNTTQQIISALSSLSSSKDGGSATGRVMAWRRQKTFQRLGAGIPAAIRKAAVDMPDEELTELMRVSKRPIVEVNSRAEIEKRIGHLEIMESQQLQKKLFMTARDTRETIEELQSLRQSFPTFEDLQYEEKELEDSLKKAISFKQYDNASHLQKRLATVKEQISKEGSTALEEKSEEEEKSEKSEEEVVVLAEEEDEKMEAAEC